MAKLHPKEKQLLCYLLAFKQRVPNKKSSLQDQKCAILLSIHPIV
jgi:hypothetical protein